MQRERHGETGNAQQGDERGDLHTDRAENGEREENVEHGAQRRAQIGAEGRETLGAVKRTVAQAQDERRKQFANTTKMAKNFWLLFFDFLCFFH